MNKIEFKVRKLKHELLENQKFSSCMNKNNVHKLFYDIYQEPCKRDWMLILQNPGGTKITGIPDSEAFKKWMVGKQKKVFLELFSSIKKEFNSGYKFSEFNFDSEANYSKYVNEEFFNDFYITDYVKINAKTSLLDDILKIQKDDWWEILKEEIITVQPKIILSFSGRTWECIRDKTELMVLNKMNNVYIQNEIIKSDSLQNTSITKIHGSCLKIRINSFEGCLIPLAFLPSSGQNNPLRNSYVDYFIEGLKEYSKHYFNNF